MDAKTLKFPLLNEFSDTWFERGWLEVLTGEATGLVRIIKTDVSLASFRQVTLWENLTAPIAAGDSVRIQAGCDKRTETCREKFANFLNFQGFPHIPGEDWMMSVPKRDGLNDGGSMNS